MSKPIVVTRKLLEEFYDAMAPSYDRIWLFKECGRRLVELLQIKPGANVLDVGTGTGMVLLPAAMQAGPKGRVTGIDISADMLQQAERAVEISGLTNIDLLKMDAEHLQFPDASFDVITCGFAVWYVPPAGLDEMYRVCKPSGIVGVIVPDRILTDTLPEKMFNELAKDFGVEVPLAQQAAFSPEEIEALLASHGFVHTQTVRERNERVFASLEEFWENMNPGTRMVLWSMDAATRARFKEAYLGRVTSLVQQDGVHYVIPVIYSIAQR